MRNTRKLIEKKYLSDKVVQNREAKPPQEKPFIFSKFSHFIPKNTRHPRQALPTYQTFYDGDPDRQSH